MAKQYFKVFVRGQAAFRGHVFIAAETPEQAAEIAEKESRGAVHVTWRASPGVPWTTVGERLPIPVDFVDDDKEVP